MSLYLFGAIYFWTVCFSSAQDPCGQRQYYYVSSNGTDSSQCLEPGDVGHPCSTLSYVLQSINTDQCYTVVILSNIILNNTVMESILTNNTSIVGASNVTDPVTIHCEGNSGMVLDSVTDFTLQDLQFKGCSFDVTEYRKYVSEFEIPSNFTSIWINSSSNINICGCFFENHSGSSIFLENVFDNITLSSSNITGDSSLLDSIRSRSGGIIVRLFTAPSDAASVRINISFCYFNSSYSMMPNNTFRKTRPGDYSSHLYGGALDITHSVDQSSLLVFIDDCKFQNNAARFGGAVSIIATSATLMSISNSYFAGNIAYGEGGAVRIAHSDQTVGHLQVEFIQCTFIQNSAYWGGAVAVIANKCISCSKTISITFMYTSFTSNTANDSGFAIALHGPDVVNSVDDVSVYLHAYFFGNIYILNNYGGVSGAVVAENSMITFGNNSFTAISGTSGTGMVLRNSKADINGDTSFTGNSGTIGAAIYIEGDSFISFGPISYTLFFDNTVSLYGGAIYSSVTKYCTFEVSDSESTKVIFVTNHANLLDQSIYVSSGDKCSDSNLDFYSLFEFQPPVSTQVLFPVHYVAIDFEPETRKVMLGEKFDLKPTEIRDAFGHPSIGIGYIRFQTINYTYSLRGPSTISLDNYTGNLEFFVVGPIITEGEEEATIDIYYQREVGTYEVSKVQITFSIVPCRIGYKYLPEQEVCVCEAESSADLFRCDPRGQMLCVHRHYWYSTDFQVTYPCPAQNCMFVHNECPRKSTKCDNSTEYCGIQEEDDVCWEGRSGFLCSECASNYSFTFSGVQCSSSTSCHSWSTFLQLLALVVYWILFIVVLLIGLSLNLGVGSGFMFGIVYFFSVIHIYIGSSDLYTATWIRILLYVDVAIAQCDPELLGYVTNTCFAETWNNPLPHELFRYATPLFLILIMLLLILFSRYCRVPKFLSLADNSPIHAICLLILLCYTSISYTSLKLLFPMRVNDSLRVQVAPTLSYFSREHIPYAVVGICAELFISIPICVLFLFAPLISRRVNLVKLRLKPIVDEFQACYKPEYRWFAGFYFLTRQIICLVSLTYLGPFPQLNYILTTVNILVLLTHVFTQPYSRKWLNILDTVLLTDIVILPQLTPVKVETTSIVNQFFYGILIPYALVLFPSIYLFIALGLVVIRKFCKICFRFKFCAKKPKSRLGLALWSILLKANSETNFGSTNLQNLISNTNSLLREPLLEDLDTERSKVTTSLYGST